MMRVIDGNCLAVLPTLEASFANYVICDPPYGQSNESYDSPIAFRPDVWRECYRVTKPDAALVAFTGSPTYHRIASAIEAAGWKVRQMWAWVYRDGMITSAYPKDGFDRLAPAMDPIVFATKGKVLLQLKREGVPWEISSRTASTLSKRSKGKNGTLVAHGHWPRNIVSDGCDPFTYFVYSRRLGGEDRSSHPNQKPLPLMQWLCAKFPPGIVLDPFSGSGTTLMAAMAEGHTDAIGIEQDPEYAAIARQRIQDASTSNQQATPFLAPAGSASNGHHKRASSQMMIPGLFDECD